MCYKCTCWHRNIFFQHVTVHSLSQHRKELPLPTTAVYSIMNDPRRAGRRLPPSLVTFLTRKQGNLFTQLWHLHFPNLHSEQWSGHRWNAVCAFRHVLREINERMPFIISHQDVSVGRYDFCLVNAVKKRRGRQLGSEIQEMMSPWAPPNSSLLWHCDYPPPPQCLCFSAGTKTMYMKKIKVKSEVAAN